MLTTTGVSAPTASAAAVLAPRLPLVVTMMGLPGAGKSVVARALERELGLRRVCREAIRRALFPQCSYSFIEKRAAFRSVLLALEINGVLGESSVVDGVTFSRREDFEQIAALGDARGFGVLPLLIDCPPKLARARFVRDELARRNSDPGLDARFVEAGPAVFDEPPLRTLRIDGALPMVDVCRLAVAEVAARLVRAPNAVGR